MKRPYHDGIIKDPNALLLCVHCGNLCKRMEQEEKTGWCEDCVMLREKLNAERDSEIRLEREEEEYVLTDK